MTKKIKINPRQVLTYSSLSVVGLAIIAMFVTATNYLQLAIAIVVYPALIYFAYKTLSRQTGKPRRPAVMPKPATLPSYSQGITDIDKRGFLKLIGAAGLSFFLFSLFGKKTEVPFLGKLARAAGQADQDPTDSYRISEVDDGTVTFYGFTRQGGAWFIMQEDSVAGSFRYVKGNSDFSGNWARRANLQYDYYHNVF